MSCEPKNRMIENGGKLSKMNPETELLFTCTRQDFLKTHSKKIIEICRNNEEIKWDYVYSTAESHGVEALIYYNLKSVSANIANIPSAMVETFRRGYMSSIVRASKIAEKVQEILSFFNHKSIDVMLLKGTALEILGVYEKPWHSLSSDIDLIIKSTETELSQGDKREIIDFLQNFLPWCEWELYEHHDVSMNNVLPIDFQQIWQDAIKTTFSKQDVFVMSPEDLLISVCINSSRKRFFRLKSLYDISEIVAKQSYLNLNWENMVRKAKDYHCNDIVYAALFIANITLDCKIPEQVFNNLAINPIKAKIIRYLSKRQYFSSPLDTYSNLNIGRNFLGRRIAPSMFLPLITLRNYQIWRKTKYIWKTRQGVV